MAQRTGEEGGAGDGLPRRHAASLGWLTESSVQPRKAQKIEGVSSAGMVALKASVIKAQQEAAALREGRIDMAELRAQRRGPGSLLDRANAGVADRDRRDKLHIKSTSDRLSESAAALERKAALYDRLAAGGGSEEQAEQYEVDFLMKAAAGPPSAIDTADAASRSVTGGLFSADMERERQRRDWEAEAGANLASETAAEERRRQRREVMGEVVEEMRAGREAAAGARAARAAADAARRERLKRAYLKKQVELLKAKQAPGKAVQQPDGQHPLP